MILWISHTTTYKYDRVVDGASYMEARLRPLTISGTQSCLEYSLTTDPATNVFWHEQPDQMGAVAHFTLRHVPHDRLIVHSESTVETYGTNPYLDVNLFADDWSVLESNNIASRMPEWLAPTPTVPFNHNWTGPAKSKHGVFQFGVDLMREIHNQFKYTPGSTEISTPLEEFVAQGKGVCQDYAHYMLSVARSQGIPGRYVSGYIYSGNDSEVLGGDAMHAWVELYLPEEGIWKGFDPTNNLVVADHHVKIAVGRDYKDVPPTKGIIRGIPGGKLPHQSELDVIVTVRQIERPNGISIG